MGKAAMKRLVEAHWWDDMSDEHKKEYVEEHPHSKYADQYKKEKEPKAEDKHDDSPEHKPSKHEDKKHGLLKSLKGSFKMLPQADQEAYAAGEHKPGSKMRKAAGTLVKSKTKGILNHLKGQAHEWKAGVGALRKLAKGEDMSHHDKEALRACAQDLVITVVGVALTGGLIHGIASALAHLGQHFVTDAALKALGHAATHAKVMAAGKEVSDDELMTAIINQLADDLENADIPNDVMAKAINNQVKAEKEEASTQDYNLLSEI